MDAEQARRTTQLAVAVEILITPPLILSTQVPNFSMAFIAWSFQGD
jgi:hypothetical protein